MLDAINHAILTAADFLLGWLLYLPMDLALIIVAVGSALVLTAVRVWSSDQDLLRRCKQDKARLAKLIREAKRRKDREAIQRHRATSNMIGLKQLRQEGWPLLAALIPLVLIATWSFYRLEFHPPRAGEPVKFTAAFPISSAGKLAHIVPQDGLRAEPGWIQQLEVVTAPNAAPAAEATWTVRAEAREQPYEIEVRRGDQTLRHSLLIGQKRYEPTVALHGGETATWVDLQPVKLFGIVPGIPWLFLAPWLVAYLIIVIPFVFILRRVLRIY